MTEWVTLGKTQTEAESNYNLQMCSHTHSQESPFIYSYIYNLLRIYL